MGPPSTRSPGLPNRVEKIERPGRSLSLRVLEASPQTVKLVKRIEDATINCKISTGPRESWNINTSVKSFDKMLSLFAQYSKLNLDLHLETSKIKSSTWIIENVGEILGEALKILAQERSKTTGIRKLGHSQGLYGEAFAEVRTLLMGKAGCWITRGPNAKFFGRVGEVSEEALKSFFVEFAQAINGTLHIDLIRGEDPYHLWFAAFIAFGEALANAFTEDEWYKQQGIAESIA